MTESTPNTKASVWIEDRISRLPPPEKAYETDPNDKARAIQNNDFGGSRFVHPDGDRLMAVYVLGSHPESNEPVGAAVIFMPDDTRMFHLAKSIQGVHFQEAQGELLRDYLQLFADDHKPKSSGMGLS